MDKTEWIEKRVEYIKGLKAPSDMQKLILELYNEKKRTANENKQLDALLKVEKINERAELAKVQAYKIVNARKEETRKARTRELIELGGIVQLTEFEKDKGLLAGVLLYALDQFKGHNGENLKTTLKVRGDKLLDEREEAKKSKTPT
ncbi:MAG: conjugal transfer protein TraD [Pseudomonadota bacterium]